MRPKTFTPPPIQLGLTLKAGAILKLVQHGEHGSGQSAYPNRQVYDVFAIYHAHCPQKYWVSWDGESAELVAVSSLRTFDIVVLPESKGGRD